MGRLNKEFMTLKDTDLYSIALFALYKLTDIPEYSIIGELPYILDKTNLLNMCNYFGGQTIRIPTLAEISSILNVILLYQYVNIDKMAYDDAVKLIGFKSNELRKVKQVYTRVCEVLNKYNFNRGTNVS